MVMIHRPGMRSASWATPRLDLGDCVLYAPLWHPTLAKSPSQTKDKIGHLCTVTGTTWGYQGRTFVADDNISIPNHASLVLGTSNFTLISWFKTTKQTQGVVFMKRGGAGNWYTFYVTAAHILKLELSGTDNSAGSSTVTTGLWVQGIIVRNYTANTCQMYVNGVAETVTVTGNMNIDVTNTAAITIGRYAAGTETFVGSQGEDWIIPRAFTANDAKQNFQRNQWRYKS